ncbi:RecF/RecN/SMC N terminal domain-containing protein [Melanogaster broomeanus]|nr:RecF/RecN/SMC N terminal domain-containing protein [Melanogaster broomeanus]
MYRKCRFEDIKLPLLAGNPKNVPMEENLRDEMAMDVDEDEDGTQRPKQVQDYGIEVDFAALDDEDRGLMQSNDPEALAEFDASIVKLNADIERMAPNLKAIERLDDVEARLIKTERGRNGSQGFEGCERSAYVHISDRIDEVYKDLTKGTLRCWDQVPHHDPYEAIPGYGTTSGGEKTVAALALLFAIHSYQPAPFFVLDEVDAALDNANVAKIANYIRWQASDSFQFIVISPKGSLYERRH